MNTQDFTDKNTLAATVAADIRGLERSFDDMLIQVGSFLQTLPEARRAAGLGANVGQRALEAVGDATRDIISGRGHLVRAHDRFALDATRLGLDWTVLGPNEDKGEPGEIVTTRPQGALTNPD